MPRVARASLRRHGGVEQHASTLELFYDLVFVFAITQVSHLLLHRLTWEGAGQSALVLLVVWWSWNYTTWVTNELDPESIVVRLLLIALMLASLLMAIAIPEAFGDRALLFVASYVAIQVGRHSFLTFATADRATIERQRAGRILTWFVAAGVLWIAGALADGLARTLLWLAALALDYGAPLVTFWLPGQPALSPEAWDVGTEHFAERFQLFIIIALGETIVITGATTAQLKLTTARVAAFALAFLTTAALWWLYFNLVATTAERQLAKAKNRTLLARDAYTYLHVVIVAGILLTAVGDELVIAHPTQELSTRSWSPWSAVRRSTCSRTSRCGSGWPGRSAAATLRVRSRDSRSARLGRSRPRWSSSDSVFWVLVAVIVGDQVAADRRQIRNGPAPPAQLETAG